MYIYSLQKKLEIKILINYNILTHSHKHLLIINKAKLNKTNKKEEEKQNKIKKDLEFYN